MKKYPKMDRTKFIKLLKNVSYSEQVYDWYEQMNISYAIFKKLGLDETKPTKMKSKHMFSCNAYESFVLSHMYLSDVNTTFSMHKLFLGDKSKDNTDITGITGDKNFDCVSSGLVEAPKSLRLFRKYISKIYNIYTTKTADNMISRIFKKYNVNIMTCTEERERFKNIFYSPKNLVRHVSITKTYAAILPYYRLMEYADDRYMNLYKHFTSYTSIKNLNNVFEILFRNKVFSGAFFPVLSLAYMTADQALDYFFVPNYATCGIIEHSENARPYIWNDKELDWACTFLSVYTNTNTEKMQLENEFLYQYNASRAIQNAVLVDLYKEYEKLK